MMMSPIAMITTSLSGLRRGSVRCVTSLAAAVDAVDPWDIIRNLPINDGKDKDDELRIPLPTKLSPTSLETFK